MITETNAYYTSLRGSSYEVGKTLAYMIKEVPEAVKACMVPEDIFSKEEMSQILRLFDKFCPGINDEIAGFSDTLRIPVPQVMYYAWAYLKPGCSQMVVLPSLTKDNHILIARNYDMSDKVEEIRMSATRIKGRYAHIGSSIALFGRGDGMNEHGLVVSQTSIGIPVGASAPFRKPAVKGLQFGAVIRAVLEQCRTVSEALNLVKEMPISYNINLLLADRGGNAALIETLDGRKEVETIDSGSSEQFLCSTNHAVLPELQRYEPKKLRNSAIRYELINKVLSEASDIEKADLKNLLSGEYPEGLSCSYYEDFFGTLRSMIFDPTSGTMDVRFGSPDLNDWHVFDFNGRMESEVYGVKLKKERCLPDFYEFI